MKDTVIVSKPLADQRQFPYILMTGEAAFAIERFDVVDGLLIGRGNGHETVVALPIHSNFLILHRDAVEIKNEEELLRERVRKQQLLKRVVASEQPVLMEDGGKAREGRA